MPGRRGRGTKHDPRRGQGKFVNNDLRFALGNMLLLKGSLDKAETAVLNYLEGYWSANRRATLEERFLDLFAELSSVRDCCRQTAGRG